jgi:hypothetical protein
MKKLVGLSLLGILAFTAHAFAIPTAVDNPMGFAPMERPPANCADDLKLAAPDLFLQKFQADPEEVYEKIQARAKKAFDAGESTFSFYEMQPVLAKILKAIDKNLAGDLTPARRDRFLKLKDTGERLKKEKVPYHPFIRYLFEFLHLVDEIYREAFPQYDKEKFHEKLAKHELEKALEEWPDAIIFFSFQPVNTKYFLDTRTAPLHLVGGTLTHLFADGFPLTPTEFGYHDVGHFSYMIMRDKALRARKGPGWDEKRARKKWKQNKRYYNAKELELYKTDPVLAHAANLVRFEVIHERGYQYDLASLKSQFESSRWATVVLEKLQNGFWAQPPITIEQAARLDEARLWLLKITEEKIKAEAARHLLGYAPHSRVEFYYQPSVLPSRGVVHHIEISNRGAQAYLYLEDHDQGYHVSVYDVTLAQVKKSPFSPFTIEFVEKMNELLMRDQALLSTGELVTVNKVIIKDDVSVKVEVDVPLRGTRLVSIEDCTPTGQRKRPAPAMDAVVLFKIEQILWLAQNKQFAKFNLIPGVEKIEASFLEVKNGLVKIGPSGEEVSGVPPSERWIHLQDIFFEEDW